MPADQPAADEAAAVAGGIRASNPSVVITDETAADAFCYAAGAAAGRIGVRDVPVVIADEPTAAAVVATACAGTGGVGIGERSSVRAGEGAVEDAEIGDGRAAGNGMEERGGQAADGVIIAIERAVEDADGDPYSGHSQVGL